MAYPDYGLMTNMASGLKEGLIAYQTNKNIERQNQLYNLMNGVQQNPTTGALEFTPEKQKMMDLARMKAEQEAQSYDPNSDFSKSARGLLSQQGVQVPENISAYQSKQFEPILTAKLRADESKQLKQAMAPYQAERLGLMQDRLSQSVHQKALNEFSNDKNAQQLVQTYQNLQNAKRNFLEGGATPQDFAELQQAVASNAGIKGSSGVSERSERYLSSLGLNASKVKQFLTGDPQSVLKSDPAFAKQILHLVDLEEQNKQGQFQTAINKHLSKHQSFYDDPRHADLKKDYLNSVNAYLGQIPTSSEEGGLLQRPEATMSAIPNGRVTVISPTGQIGHIPREQLQDALKQGFREQK